MYKYIMATLLVASIIMVPALVEAKTYSGQSYSFKYPAGCKPDSDANKYSDSAFLRCKEDMMIQLNSGGMEGSDLSSETNEDLVDEMITLFSTSAGWEDVEEVERGNMTIGNQSAPYVIATYAQTYNGLFGFPNGEEDEFVALIVAINISDGYVIGQYKNNAGDFDKGKSMAEKIFTSITPEGDGKNSTQKSQSAYERCQSKSQDEYENLRDECGDGV